MIAHKYFFHKQKRRIEEKKKKEYSLLQLSETGFG